MKKYFSVFMVASRSTIYKILGLLAVSAAFEIILPYVLIQNMVSSEIYSLDTFVNRSGLPLVSGVAFVALCIILCSIGYERSGVKVRYTIRRLSIREETTVLIWTLYNIICIMIFWSVHILISIIVCKLYINVNMVEFKEQTIFITFYSNKFLHSLLPMEEALRWYRNIIMAVALGTSASLFSLKQRRNYRGIAIVVLTAITLLSFSCEFDNFFPDMSVILTAIIAEIYFIYEIYWGENNEN